MGMGPRNTCRVQGAFLLLLCVPAALAQMEAAGALLQTATKAVMDGVQGTLRASGASQSTAIDPGTLNADGIAGGTPSGNRRTGAAVQRAALATAEAVGTTAAAAGGAPGSVDPGTLQDVAQRTANAAGNGTGPLSVVAQILSPVGDATVGTLQGTAQNIGLSSVLDFSNLSSKNETYQVPAELRTMFWLPAVTGNARLPAVPSPYKGFKFPNETETVTSLLNSTQTPVTMYWGVLNGLPQATTDSGLGLPDGVLPVKDSGGTVVATFHPSQSGNPYLYFGVGASDSQASPLGYNPGGIGPKKNCQKSPSACSLTAPIYTPGVSIKIANASVTHAFTLTSLWMNSYFPITLIGHRPDGTSVKRVLEGTYPVPSADAQKAAAQRYNTLTSLAQSPVDTAKNILANPLDTAMNVMNGGGGDAGNGPTLYDRVFPSGVPDALVDTASRTVTAAAGAATSNAPLVNLVYGRTFRFDRLQWAGLDSIEFTSPDVINTMLVVDDVTVDVLGDIAAIGSSGPMNAASSAASQIVDTAVSVAKQVPEIRLPGLPAIPSVDGAAAPLRDSDAVEALPFADILLGSSGPSPSSASPSTSSSRGSREG